MVIIEKGTTLFEKWTKFLESRCFAQYPFNKKELTIIKFDINITNVNSKTFSTYASVAWAKNQISEFPMIKPLIQFLKRLLQQHDLNSSYNG